MSEPGLSLVPVGLLLIYTSIISTGCFVDSSEPWTGVLASRWVYAKFSTPFPGRDLMHFS